MGKRPKSTNSEQQRFTASICFALNVATLEELWAKEPFGPYQRALHSKHNGRKINGPSSHGGLKILWRLVRDHIQGKPLDDLREPIAQEFLKPNHRELTLNPGIISAVWRQFERRRDDAEDEPVSSSSELSSPRRQSGVCNFRDVVPGQLVKSNNEHIDDQSEYDDNELNVEKITINPVLQDRDSRPTKRPRLDAATFTDRIRASTAKHKDLDDRLAMAQLEYDANMTETGSLKQEIAIATEELIKIDREAVRKDELQEMCVDVLGRLSATEDFSDDGTLSELRETASDAVGNVLRYMQSFTEEKRDLVEENVRDLTSQLGLLEEDLPRLATRVQELEHLQKPLWKRGLW